MSSAISAITPRLFPQVPHQPVRLTRNDFFPTPRVEIPPVQSTSNYTVPAPAKEILMATALASWAPIIAKTLIEQEKKESEASAPNYTLAA